MTIRGLGGVAPALFRGRGEEGRELKWGEIITILQIYLKVLTKTGNVSNARKVDGMKFGFLVAHTGLPSENLFTVRQGLNE